MNTTALTIVSLVYDLALLAFSGWWLFNIDRTPYDRCLSVFLLPLLVLIVVSISRRRLDQKRASSPITVNLVTFVLIISLAIFRSYWDLDFILHGREYSAALQAINASVLDVSQENLVTVKLPQQYRHLSQTEEVFVTKDNSADTILIAFPITPDDLDGLMNAYVYVSGEKTRRVPEKCLSGRPVNPLYEN